MFGRMLLKQLCPHLTFECYGGKVGGNYDRVPVWFSRNQFPPSMANRSETDLKKKASLKQKQESTNNATSG